MQDIITVNVDLTTAAFKTITGDFKLFGFKTFNDIANTIIVNHATEYYTHLEHLENEITRVLEEHNIPNRTNYALLPKLVLISERYDRPRDTLQSKNIVIQKDYVETFIALEDYFNDVFNQKLSFRSYLKYIFDDYATHTRAERELILFKNTYQILKKAIKSKKFIHITKSNGHTYTLLPLDILNVFDNENLFVCGQDKEDQFKSIELSTISNITITEEKGTASPSIKDELKKLKKQTFDLSALFKMLDLDDIRPMMNYIDSIVGKKS